MEFDPRASRSPDDLDQQFLDLALAVHNAVGWSIEHAGADVAWMPGMDELLGMAGRAERDVQARLLELLEPFRAGADTTARGQELDLEHQVSGPDGEVRVLHFHARPTGRSGGLIGLVRDITALHRDRRALADLAGRYRLLVELSPDVILVHQHEIIRYANTAARTILGADSSEQLVGRDLTDIVAPATIPEMRERIRSLTYPGAATARSQADLRRLDGVPVPVELVSVLTSWEGAPALQVVARDVTAQKAAESTLRYQAALVQHVNDAIIATDRQGLVTSWNPAAEEVYGVTAQQALGRHVAELVGAPLQPAEVLAIGGATETRHRRSDGSALVIRLSAAEMGSGYVLVCGDETARRRAEQDFATVVDALDEGVIVVGPDDVVESANPAAGRVLGADTSAIVGSSIDTWRLFDETGTELRPDEDPSRTTRRTGRPQRWRVLRLERSDGHGAWLAVNSRPLNPLENPLRRVVTSFTDITEARANRERLQYEANHDPLTGLVNRTRVLQHLGAPREPRPLAVLFLDLDNFKRINDSLGHATGDEVLRVVGERLVRTAPDEALVGRLGGDEFVVVHNESAEAVLGELGERLLATLTEPIHVQGRRLHVAGSIGVVVSRPGDARVAQDVLRDADVAMYQAKTRGGARCAFFGVELRERVQRNMALEQDLRHAVEQDQLWVAYQPIVDAASGRTAVVEALLRWAHPVHGTVSPGEFIPLAEESDLIDHIGAHMLRVASRQLAAERRRHRIDLRLNVNLSPRQLEDHRLPELVRQALAESGLPAHALCFEITEHALIHDPDAANRMLNGLRELGVRLAIDDFGTGNSSLAQLWRLPVDTLKIDRSFVTELGESDRLGVIVTSIVAMAHAVGLEVVGEGVETPRQLQLLRELGCDQVQGFYLGKPAPLAELLP